MQITAITPEQKARFQEWRDRWIRIGLSTEPADFEKAEKAALRAYELCGLTRPSVILRMGSPYAATLGGMMARLALYTPSSCVGNHDDVRQRLLEQVYRQVTKKFSEQVHEPIRHHVSRQVWDQVREHVWNPIGTQVLDQVREQVLQKFQQQIGQEGWEQIRQRVHGIDEELGSYHRSGAFWAGWCAYVTFLRDVLGWKDPVLERFSTDEDLSTSCGLVWWHYNVLAISDRPSEIHLDAEGRLHNEQGPSIAYRDGWKLYHVHGVAVPDFVVERPETITVGHIESARNVEVRRVMVSRMGLERFIRASGLKPVHSDDFGTLYRKEMPGDEPLVVVKVLNSTPESDGSRKEYFLRVPPNITRAHEAVAWTFGMAEREYRPATET